MDENPNDVNKASETSPDAEVTRELQTDTSKQDKPETLQDVVSGVLEKHGIQEENKSDEASESDVQKLNKTEGDEEQPPVKQEQKQDEKKEDAAVETPKPLTDEEIAKLPKRAQERIRELIDERKSLEAKYTEPATRMGNVERFCQESNITAIDFDNTLKLLALSKTKPAEAIPQIEALLSHLKQESGLSLQPDLQKKVDDGVLDAETAKEINRLRLSEQNGKRQSEQFQQQQRQGVQQQLAQAAMSWETQKKTVDPDFKPKAKADAPDGVYEFTMLKCNQEFPNAKLYTINDAVALLDRCYNSVKQSVTGFLPRPKPRKAPVHSNGSSHTKEELKIDVTKPGWARQVAKAHLANRD